MPHHICYGMVHNQYTHIHFSGILYTSKFYHHNNILLYISNQISYTPQPIMHYFNVQVKTFLEHFYKNRIDILSKKPCTPYYSGYEQDRLFLHIKAHMLSEQSVTYQPDHELCWMHTTSSWETCINHNIF